MKTEEKKSIIKKLKEYKKNSEYSKYIKELGLFGSYTNASFTKKSDIDIFIRLEPARMFDLVGIKNDLEKLLGKKVDIITLRNSMNPYLKNQIEQKGIYV
jgi:uncharacterized protein